MATDNEKKDTKKQQRVNKRTYISQSDIPMYTIEGALRVARALVENYAGGPATPLQVASALNMTPTSSTFRNLCGSSIAYGFTKGGYGAKEIVVEPLAKRILQPTKEGDDLVAKREAALKPRIIGDFIRKYKDSPLPKHDIALNVIAEMDVPRERSESVYTMILDTAQSVGFIKEIKDKQFIDLSGVREPIKIEGEEKEEEEQEVLTEEVIARKVAGEPLVKEEKPIVENNRVFISHGKNKQIVNQLKELLTYGKFEPVVSVERETTSIPVPEKVYEDMRSCAAGVIHVMSEGELLDSEGEKHIHINENVLIEIGAAIALYGKRVILLVQKGIELPSNLQGLYRCEYEGDKLDYEATMKLLKTFTQFRQL